MLFKFNSFSLYRKTPKYKTPSITKHSSWIQRSIRPEEIKRLSFDCCAEADGTLTESVTCTISPGEGENIEDKFQECLLQLESVSMIYCYTMNQKLTFWLLIYAPALFETAKTA